MLKKSRHPEKYRKLSIFTAIFMVLLMVGFYLVSIFYTNSIIGGLQNIKEHPFPVVIAAYDMEANSLQIRVLLEQMGRVRTEQALQEINDSFIQNREDSEVALATLVNLYLTEPAAVERIRELYDEVLRQEQELLRLCRDDTVDDDSIDEYIDNSVLPVLDAMDWELELLNQNATAKFDEFYKQSLSYRDIMIALVTVLGMAVIGALAIYQIILKKREAEAVFLQKQIAEAAQAANVAKSQFLSNMSHDIRTPMNAIIGMTAIAGTRLDDKERVKDCLGKIATSSRHLLSLINDILDMSKIESGKVVLNLEPVCIPDFIHDFVTIIQSQVKAKQLELDLSILGVKNEMVITDSLRLHQVMQNIMSNAIKFTDKEGTVKLRIEQKPFDRSGYALYEFVFSDNGIGMTEEFQKVMFDPFERAATSTVSRTEGTGLGMSITKNIIDIMGGTISVQSRLNKGSTFTVTIPFRVVNQNEESIPDLFKELRSLVVDDDKDVCENTVGLLEEIGIKSEWVLSGAEAVSRVDAAHKRCLDYHVVILDWQMPEMDGIETAKRIRKKVGDGIPIIILSAYDWSDIEQEAREAGITAFISKPLFKSRLYQVMCGALLNEDGTKMKEHTLQYSSKGFGHVLLVEDNELNAEIAQVLLTDRDIQVDIAEDGQKAVDMIKQRAAAYDLIFMDVQMPVMDGYEATKEIRSLEEREQRKHNVIVGMSANAFREDRDKAILMGMDDYITKPIDGNELQRILNKYCSVAETGQL